MTTDFTCISESPECPLAPQGHKPIDQVTYPLSPTPLTQDPTFKPLSQDRYQELKAYYTGFKSEAHDLNLTNLMIWRYKHNLHTLEVGQYLFIIYYPHDDKKCMVSEPIGDTSNLEDLQKAIQGVVSLFKASQLKLIWRHVSRAFLAQLEQLAYTFSAEEIEDDFDYCYKAADLAHLSGNRYHKKKNHVNQFVKQRLDRYRIEPINALNAPLALQASRSWCIANGCKGDYDLCIEYRGIAEILENWPDQEARGLEGVVVLIDDQPEAMSFGEPMHDGSFLVHVEKASMAHPSLYAVVNNAMAKQVYERFETLNREQDMGLPGIRQAKQSYLPSHLVAKLDVSITY